VEEAEAHDEMVVAAVARGGSKEAEMAQVLLAGCHRKTKKPLKLAREGSQANHEHKSVIAAE